MAINTTTAAPFIPEIWANEALEILRSNIVVAPLVTKDSDIATFQVGNTLSIPYPGTLAANDKVQGSPVTKQTPNSTSTTVTLNKHKESTILIEDFTRAQALPSLMRSYIQAEVVAIAEQVETDLIGLYSSFSGSVGTSGTDLTAATLRAINKKFTDNKIPKGYRPYDIRNDVKIYLGVDVNYSLAWRAREKALVSLRGTVDASYSKLPAYLYVMNIKYPGLHIRLEKIDKNEFLYIFVALNSFIQGFEHCRPVIVVDGSHPRGPYNGTFVGASSTDGAGMIHFFYCSIFINLIMCVN